MRYKVVKKTFIYNDKVVEYYFVQYEKKVWWKKEPVWRWCREHTYASDSWRGEPVSRNTLKEAEDYIKVQMKLNNGDFKDEDIKIYECRDSKLEKILK
jgi:hypothetical protein